MAKKSSKPSKDQQVSKKLQMSKRQQRMLKYISEYIQDAGRPPTIREIGTAAEISSTSVVNYNLTKLAEKGYIDRDAEVSRGLRLARSEHQADTTTRTVRTGNRERPRSGTREERPVVRWGRRGHGSRTLYRVLLSFPSAPKAARLRPLLLLSQHPQY